MASDLNGAAGVNAAPGAVDPQGVHQHITLANLLSKGAHRCHAVGVVAVGDEQQRFLHVRAGLRSGDRH
jgi:hypothetical protein